MNEELKRCPFCGGEAKLISGIGRFYVICSDDLDVNGAHCAFAMGSILYDTREKAIAAWNRRV